MDISKLKIDLYDFLAVLIPGLLTVCALGITVGGWPGFLRYIANLSASAFTLLLFASFALGPIVQELADATVKAWKGERFLKSSRDKLWISPTGAQVRSKIAADLGRDIDDVDVAFDYCLTKSQAYFLKRDLFLANSDLSRSMIVVCGIAILPLTRLVLSLPMPWWRMAAALTGCAAGIVLAARLCWTRMKRFRALSETPVFHTYLALPVSQKATPAEK